MEVWTSADAEGPLAATAPNYCSFHETVQPEGGPCRACRIEAMIPAATAIARAAAADAPPVDET